MSFASFSKQWFSGQALAIRRAFLAVALILTIGTLGYHTIEGWSLFDSFYMTVITVSTVGFSEVGNLSKLGRLFTSGVIIMGVGTAFYAWAIISQAIIEGEINQLRGFRRMLKRINKFKDHIIICGYGRLASIVLRELTEGGNDVVTIELNPDRIQMLENNEYAYIEGSAYNDEILEKAGIHRAKTLLALLPSDADNVYATLCARDLNPQIRIIARAEDEASETRLLRAGADQILAPYRVSGNRVVQKLTQPRVSEFLEFAVGQPYAKRQLLIEEIPVPTESALGGKTLEQTKLRQETGAIIAAFINSDGEMVFNPGGASIIEPDSTLIVLGPRDSIEKLNSLLSENVANTMRGYYGEVAYNFRPGGSEEPTLV